MKGHDEEAKRDGAGESAARAIDWGVAAPALILVLAIAVWAIAVPEGFGRASSAAFTWLVDTLGWAFIIAAVVFFIAMIALAFSPLGHIRLGRDGEQPEFSTTGWIAMMFAAGMGIGLLLSLIHISEPTRPY